MVMSQVFHAVKNQDDQEQLNKGGKKACGETGIVVKVFHLFSTLLRKSCKEKQVSEDSEKMKKGI